MDKPADEPRALSMSLDDIIKENRDKTGYRNTHRNSRGGAHFVPNKRGGKQSFNNNRGDRVVQRHRSVRAKYEWETADGGIEHMSFLVEGKELIKIHSNGDVIVRSDVDHDWAVFAPMNTCLTPVQMKLSFDGDIKKEWTLRNEAGWNRILDTDITVSAFPARKWEAIRHALQQLPESISLQPNKQSATEMGVRRGSTHPAMGGSWAPGPAALLPGQLMDPMMMMMMMAQQQAMLTGAPLAAAGPPVGFNARPDSAFGRGVGRGEYSSYPGGRGRGSRGRGRGGY